jgi:hypothetical protein
MRPLRGVRGRIVYTVFSGIGEVLPPKCKVGAWERSIACWLLLALAEALVDGQSRGCVRYGRGSTNMSLTVTSRLMAYGVEGLKRRRVWKDEFGASNAWGNNQNNSPE